MVKNREALILQYYLTFAATVGCAGAITLFCSLALWFRWFDDFFMAILLLQWVGMAIAVVACGILSVKAFHFYNVEQAYRLSALMQIPYDDALMPDHSGRYFPLALLGSVLYRAMETLGEARIWYEMEIDWVPLFWTIGVVATLMFVIGIVMMVIMTRIALSWRAERLAEKPIERPDELPMWLKRLTPGECWQMLSKTSITY